jgi:hypothetical protein
VSFVIGFIPVEIVALHLYIPPSVPVSADIVKLVHKHPTITMLYPSVVSGGANTNVNVLLASDSPYLPDTVVLAVGITTSATVDCKATPQALCIKSICPVSL